MSQEQKSKNNSYELINLQKYSNFNSVQEMDFIVKEYNKELKKTHYETLNLLKQYSCKFVGISHLKIATIATKLEKNIRTIKRHIKYLKEEGFITVIPTLRIKKGGTGANAYVINSPEQRDKVLKNKNDTAKTSPRNHNKNGSKNAKQRLLNSVLIPKQTINSLKLYISSKVTKYQDNKTRIENIKNYQSKPENVPQEVFVLNKAYFTNTQMEYLYNCVVQTLNKHDMEVKFDLVIDSFKALVLKMKDYYHGKSEKIKDIFKYMRGIVQKKINDTTEKQNDVSQMNRSKQLNSREMTPKWLENKEENQQQNAEELTEQDKRNREALLKKLNNHSLKK